MTALLLSVAWSAAAAGSPKPKHFVVALVDDLGGYNVPWRNPKQRMADDLVQLSTEEGMRLENFYTFKYCSPTRSSFLSARFPLHVNELNGGTCDAGGVDLRMKLLPQKLAGANFRSYMVGKGHIGARSAANLPVNRGFDHHLGFLGGGEDHYTQRIAVGVDLWEDAGPAHGLNGTYSCDLYSGKAVSLIEDHAANYPDKGMFLYLPFHDVHEPYEAEARFLDPGCPDSGRQTMQAMVSCVSEGTGNVSRALRKSGMWETTLFLWSSDNGGPQYWLGNNYPLRGGKGVDFEGGVATAAFVTGGALPPHLFGQASDSPMHIADLHFTICLLAGLTESACRDDAIPGVPPVDGIDFRAAFAQVNVTRPIAQGAGASAGTQEIVLSANGGVGGDQDIEGYGAYIDFNLSNGGPWKFVRNTSRVLNNPASPNGSGYWTGPIWPIGNNHTPLEADPGCPPGGCLFNLRLDRTEHREFSAEQPEIKARMAARMVELRRGRFQTSMNYTAGYDNCTAIATVVSTNQGFVGPCCTRGAGWSRTVSCDARSFEVYSPASYRGSWGCDATAGAEPALTAADDAAPDGSAIGFARINGLQLPGAGADIGGGAGAVTVSASIKLADGSDSASCGYRTGGLIVGMASKPGTASSNFRDQFDGYSVTVTPPGCTGNQARVTIQRHDAGAGGAGVPPSNQPMASGALGDAVSTAGWFQLLVTINATHIAAATFDGGGSSVPLLAARLLAGKPVGCGASAVVEREPWEPEPWESDQLDACGVGVYQHRVAASWRGFAVHAQSARGPGEQIYLDEQP